MAVAEEPILSRLDRLDNMVRQLEEIRGGSPSSGTHTSDGHPSPVDFSPKKHCRPIDRVMIETQAKGTLLDRLDQLEDRVLKLEEELEAERKREDDKGEKGRKKRKGLKDIVKKAVKGGTHRH